MLTKKDLEDQRERLQDDLITQLDGLPEGFISQVCDSVVERFDILITQLSESTLIKEIEVLKTDTADLKDRSGQYIDSQLNQIIERIKHGNTKTSKESETK